MGIPLLFVGNSAGVGVGGTTYYVDQTGGNDGNDGLTPATAWKTIAQVNGFTFVTGNRVLFKRGETWAETLVPPLSNMYYGAYGSGALPIIDGEATRATCITAINKTALTFEYLKLQNPTDSCINFNSGVHIVNFITADGSGDQNFQNDGTANVTYNDCTITGAFDDGVSIHGTAVVTINRCTLSGNEQAINTTVSGAVVTVNDSLFDSNITNDILVVTSTTLVVNRCRFTGQSGASHVSVGGWGVFNYCTWDFSDSAQVTQIGSSFSGKTLEFNNCTFYGWNGSSNRAGLATGNGAIIDLNNCIADRLWRLGYINVGGAINADHCDLYLPTIKDLTTETNIIGSNGNPLLTDPANEDFTLQATSPCLNTGADLGLTTDLAGNPVPFGAAPDVGAYERQS